MSQTHRDLIAAASEIVRESGIESLSVRQVAARSHYGKSTVHAAFGTFNGLIEAVRRRAEADLFAALCRGGDHPDDRESRDTMFERMSGWIISDPRWAEACFSRVEADMPPGWRDNALILFGKVLPEGSDLLPEEEFTALSVMGGRQIAAAIPVIAAAGDVEFGSRILEATMASLYRSFRAAVARASRPARLTALAS